jgi:hypothetical protein
MLAMLLTYVWAKRLLGVWPAALGVVLLATDITYLYFCRMDFGPNVQMFLMKAAALERLTAWWRSGRASALCLAGLFLGLGVWDKVNFIWIVFAIGGAAFLLRPREILARFGILRVEARRRKLMAFAAACVCFLVGMAPLIAFNARWPMPTFAAATGNVASKEPEPSLGGRVVQRSQVMWRLLSGNRTYAKAGTSGETLPLAPMTIAAAGFGVVALVVPSLRR